MIDVHRIAVESLDQAYLNDFLKENLIEKEAG